MMPSGDCAGFVDIGHKSQNPLWRSESVSLRLACGQPDLFHLFANRLQQNLCRLLNIRLMMSYIQSSDEGLISAVNLTF